MVVPGADLSAPAQNAFMGNGLSRLLACAGLAGCCGAALAQSAASPPNLSLALPNCVSETRLEFALADERVVLDDADRVGLGALIQRRYPVLAGFAPEAIVLWRKRGGAWLYVALARSERHTAGWCHSSSFTADAFDITPALVRKYFPGGALRA